MHGHLVGARLQALHLRLTGSGLVVGFSRVVSAHNNAASDGPDHLLSVIHRNIGATAITSGLARPVGLSKALSISAVGLASITRHNLLGHPLQHGLRTKYLPPPEVCRWAQNRHPKPHPPGRLLRAVHPSARTLLMHPSRKTAIMAAAALLAFAAATTGCGQDSTSPGPPKAGCPAALARAEGNVEQAMNTTTSWDGPTSGPKAASRRTIAFVAQTMINPGVAGVARGVREAAKVIGWDVKVIDGQGTPAGIQAAFSQAINLKPAGIVISAFDPAVTSQQVAQANARNIPLVGWHAVHSPGPSKHPRLFTNVTTRVEDVAKTSADWIIAHSQGKAGVVIFTDASVPFARNKSELIRRELTTCSGVSLLSYENIPITDTTSRVPQAVSSLLARFQNKWTYSVAINDLYFADAAPALQAAGKQGDGPPLNIGAGDGDPSAFQRINNRHYQAATIPEPLIEQGWQIIDEFNRAFSAQPASTYVAPVHISTALNSKGATSWDPTGYREAYRKIWGK
ncbi:hypothetical protein GCM10010425_31690 [Streptomyces spororaveus]